jgi:hypothetical protein
MMWASSSPVNRWRDTRRGRTFRHLKNPHLNPPRERGGRFPPVHGGIKGGVALRTRLGIVSLSNPCRVDLDDGVTTQGRPPGTAAMSGGLVNPCFPSRSGRPGRWDLARYGPIDVRESPMRCSVPRPPEASRGTTLGWSRETLSAYSAGIGVAVRCQLPGRISSFSRSVFTARI